MNSMQIYALGPCQVIKAVDGDTESFCYYIQHLLIFWQVFIKIPGEGGHPQQLGWVPGWRGTLWVCSSVTNVMWFFFPIFAVMLSVVGVANVCCYSFLSPSGLSQRQRLAAWPTTPFVWMWWSWTLGSWNACEPPEPQACFSGQVLVTGVALQQPVEDNSSVKDISPRGWRENQECLACSKLGERLSQPKGSSRAPIALSFKPGVTGAENSNLTQLGGVRCPLLPDN